MLTIDDDLLDAVAHQARVAYALQQLARHRVGIQCWKGQMDPNASEFSAEFAAAYADCSLDDHVQQVERWQHYLEELGSPPIYVV
jgi:hypothetical protein